MSVLWTPLNLTTQPKVWVDDDSLITEVSGAVSSVSDERGSVGGAFSQANAGSRPAIIYGELSGRRVIRFDGSNDAISNASANGIFRNVQAGWLVAVYKKRGTDAVATHRTLFRAERGGGSSVRFAVQVGSAETGANRIELGVRRLDTDGFVSISSASAYAGSWVVLAVQQNWGSGVGMIRVNGALVAEGATSSVGTTSDTNSFYSPTIGADNASSAERPADIDVAVLIAGSGAALSSADFERCEGWAAHRYGLTASLPSDHQYKSAPPTIGPVFMGEGVSTLDEHAGLYPVSVNTKLKATPDNVNVRAKVSLLRQRDMTLARRGWTNSSGSITFDKLRADKEHYLAIAEYPGNPPDPNADEYLRPVAGVSAKKVLP